MTVNDNIRINKVLKEFNIGMGTLVEFLSKKGIAVESNPNARISAEEYSLIEKEFKKEQIVKEESKKIAIKVKDLMEQEKAAEEQKEEPQQKELFIKTTYDEVKGPKILGKIDLDKPAAKEETKPVQPNEIHEEVKVEQKAIEPISVEPKKEEPLIQPSQHSNVNSIEQPKEEIHKQEPIISPKAITPEKPKDQYIKNPTQNNYKQNNQSKQPNNPQKQHNMNNKFSDKERGKQADAAPAPVVIEHIETKVEKLTGPVIKRTIDLSQFEKEKKKSGPDFRNKGKRERIHKQKEKVDVSKEVSKNNNNNNNNNNNRNNDRPQNQNNAKPNNVGGKHNRKDRFKPVHTEVDEDAVQKQIKETYQRMVEGKGKTKGSKYRKEKREIQSQKLQEVEQKQEKESMTLKVTEFVTVNELSIMMSVPVTGVIEACMNLGLMVSINQRLDAEALVLVAEEFGYKVDFVTAEIQETIKEENQEDKPEDLLPRPPIVTVMGHVDHGKTSLLDHIRNANVIAGEAGGITQHIGAYNVKLQNGRRITFLDTPGHEAFTAMRARGAQITDLVIIIIAADDAIMPQTKEAINHAQAAGVPMIFAINKIDKPGANPEKIREQLSQMNLLVEEWGGKYQCQEISAKKGIGVDELLDKVLLEADILDLKANPNKRSTGTVIESALDKGRGYIATILVQGGTLRIGDIMLSGCFTGRVKAMFNERGQRIETAGPSTPVSVLGLNGAPTAGEKFNVFEDEKEARDIANKREQLIRIQGLKTQKHITLEEIGRRIAIGNFQELNIIVKGDVDGSIEALSDSLIKLSTEEIHVNVIHKAVGAISESDVLLAAASNAIIVGFQVRPSSNARKIADKEGIQIRMYSVIYDAINEVKSGIEGMLAPEEKEEITATAEVRETFKISKVGTIAGCMVKEGKLTRTAKVRVIRDGIVVHTGTLGSLKRFKDDVKEVQSGYDCGLNIESYNDIKVGDVIEAYQIVEIKRTL
jgi:translation initiation factor IF-2